MAGGGVSFGCDAGAAMTLGACGWWELDDAAGALSSKYAGADSTGDSGYSVSVGAGAVVVCIVSAGAPSTTGWSCRSSGSGSTEGSGDSGSSGTGDIGGSSSSSESSATGESGIG